jgi:glycosyltransferase involved in cell wall biosynthesis
VSSDAEPRATPCATVVIPAYRAADTITACLRGLDAQDLDEPFEVIVVASGLDATADIVQRAFPRAVVFESPRRLAPGAGRNIGVEHAGASIVAFLAADCVPDRDWLRLRVEAHRAGRAVVGGYVEAATPSNLVGWAQYFAKFWGMTRYHGQRRLAPGPLFHLSYRRSVLAAFGPFGEHAIAGEDTELNDAVVAAGYQVWFDSAIRVRHLNARRWRDMLAAQREQGAAVGALSRDSPLIRYYVPSARRGLFTPLRQLGRAFVTVARHRRDLLPQLVVCSPILLIAITVRRRSFRRALRGDVAPPTVDAPRAYRREPLAVSPRPEVSAVVVAYDEERVIGACLDSLLAQTLPALEILVVDDGSTDRTVEIAASRGVPVVCLDHRGPARARNIGAGVAGGRAVVFVDADLRLNAKCVDRLTAPILRGDETATYTRDIGVANPDDPWGACWSLHRGVSPGTYMPAHLPDRWGNARAVGRDAFLRAGGYDDVGYGEDMSLAPKLGTLALAVDGARMWHHNPDSLGEIWQNARWVGRGVRIRERRGLWRAHTPWRSIAAGVSGARRARRPRYLAFRLVYDAGVIGGYLAGTIRPRRHWK